MGLLRWVLHSAYQLIVVGHSEPEPEQKKKEDDEEETTSSKEEKMKVFFQMPVHYPRYNKEEYEKMEEWKVDRLLNQYGLQAFINGGATLADKRAFAISTFLWPDPHHY